MHSYKLPKVQVPPRAPYILRFRTFLDLDNLGRNQIENATQKPVVTFNAFGPQASSMLSSRPSRDSRKSGSGKVTSHSQRAMPTSGLPATCRCQTPGEPKASSMNAFGPPHCLQLYSGNPYRAFSTQQYPARSTGHSLTEQTDGT
jgi:hypothetical protein